MAGALADLARLGAEAAQRAPRSYACFGRWTWTRTAFRHAAAEPGRSATAPYAVASDGFMTPGGMRLSEAPRSSRRLQPSVVVDPATGRMMPHPGPHIRRRRVRSFRRGSRRQRDQSPDRGPERDRTGPGGAAAIAALPPRRRISRRIWTRCRPEPNQRILTVLVYLSDDYEGGETRFLRTGLVILAAGPATPCCSATPATDGSPDPLSLHAGLPVTRGTKYIASRWIRARPFTFPPPRPLARPRSACRDGGPRPAQLARPPPPPGCRGGSSASSRSSPS